MSGLEGRLTRLTRRLGHGDGPCPACVIECVTIAEGEPLPPVRPCLYRGGCVSPVRVQQIVTIRPVGGHLMPVGEDDEGPVATEMVYGHGLRRRYEGINGAKV